MNKRILTTSDLQNEGSITFKFQNDSNCTVDLELMQKVGKGYTVITDKLNMVDGNTSHNSGVFSVNANDGTNTIKYKLASTTESGTYRFMFLVKDSEGNTILEVPYEFIITNE